MKNKSGNLRLIFLEKDVVYTYCDFKYHHDKIHILIVQYALRIVI